jgi:hypothetical protein
LTVGMFLRFQKQTGGRADRFEAAPAPKKEAGL